MTLRDYVFIVARNWIVVAVTIAIGLVTALVLAVTTQSTYTTSAQVLLTGHAPTSGQDLAYAGSYVQSRMQTYSNLEQSTSLLTSVTAALGTDESPGELANRVEIDVSQLDTVATVHASDSTAEGAARTANAVAGAFLTAVEQLEAEDSTRGASGSDPANVTVRGVITGKAGVPGSPSDPDVPFYLLAGLLAGLVASSGVVALREVLKGETPPTPVGENR